MALELHTTTNSEVEGIGQGSPLKVAQQSTVFRLPSPVCKSNLEAYPLHVASPELLADAELHGHPNAKPLQKSGWYEHAQRRNIQAQHDMGRHSTTRTDTTRHGQAQHNTDGHNTTWQAQHNTGRYGQVWAGRMEDISPTKDQATVYICKSCCASEGGAAMQAIQPPDLQKDAYGSHRHSAKVASH